jgi:hypothetical protein
MRRALIFLWLTLLQRRVARAVLGCRRPTSLIGFAAVAAFLGFLYYHRQDPIFAWCVRPEALFGGALIMIGGAVFNGFRQRGLVFEPPDIEFLFTGPFTQRQLIGYRLLTSYGYALVQSLAFLALFWPHFQHPIVAAICLALFQIACFHLATAAAIFAGSLSEELHFRLRWMLLSVYFLIAALYLRVAWDIRLVPPVLSGALTQFLFYPAVSFADLGTSSVIADSTWQLLRRRPTTLIHLWQPVLYLTIFSAAAWITLRLLFRLKASLFESALATSSRAAEKRLRRRQGRSVELLPERPLTSACLPRGRFFRGAGAIIWKNLVVAARSKREMSLAICSTLIYSGLLVVLRWLMHQFMIQGGSLPERHLRDFDLTLVGLLAFLAFFLQRTFPFDFRRDGAHLVGFRNLPMTPLALVLAELAVPTILCLAFQSLGLVLLLLFARFEWSVVVGLLLGFPAVALALNGVWNLHYLLAATRRAGGKAESASPVTMVMVVILSFLIFYPAGWVALKVGRSTFGPASEALAFGSWLAIQYLVDFLLVIVLGKLFERFEIARDHP